MKCAELGLDKHANWGKIKDWLMNALKAKGIRSAYGKAQGLYDDVLAGLKGEGAYAGAFGGVDPSDYKAIRGAFKSSPEIAGAAGDIQKEFWKGLGSTGAVYGGLGAAGYGGLRALGGGKGGPADPTDMADAVKSMQRDRLKQ